ncbi:MAG: serine/threonine protein kinase [Catenulispora sp.]|nr:serine/threonine protein kinase [Catenulispora sp.]
MERLAGDDPQWIGQYRLLRRLGAGGMGRVYLGRTAGGRTVAVKRVHTDYADDHEFRTRFRQEVAAARQVGGRWTAPVIDADTEGPQPWVATGYVAGPSLQAAVRDFGPLPPDSVRALGTGLAEALGAVHRLGLVHRDVKPSNVLLALDGPRLIDFGITRALDAAAQLTRTGHVIGSPGYLSPEQAQGSRIGPATDVFSLGAVLAFAAGGVPPFGEGQPPAMLLYRVLYEAPDLQRVSPELRPLIAACMAKNVAERPTLDQLRAGLEGGGQAVRLGYEGWLPPAISASVGRLAVELLDLDSDVGRGAGQSTASTEPLVPPVATSMPVPAPQNAVHQNPVTASATMTTPAAPAWPPATPYPAQPPSRGNRKPLLAAVGAAGAVIAVVAIVIAATSSGSSSQQGTGNGGLGSTTSTHQTSTSDGPSSSSPAPAGVVPGDYLGDWQGNLTGPTLPRPLAFNIAVAQGRPGDTVGSIVNDGGDGRVCRIQTSLVSADATRMVLRVIPSTVSAGCVPIKTDEVYTLNGDGTMHVKIGTYQADLSQQ